MTGREYEEDEPDEFRPVPHPDDRLWRHPSEMAAMQAAHANAETAKVPAVQIGQAQKTRVPTGLLVAAGVVAVGAAALTLGIVSTNSPGSTAQPATNNIVNAVAVDDRPTTTQAVSEPAREFSSIAVELSPDDEDALAAQLHDQIATSLPRIQAATTTGMREGSGLFVTSNGHIATSAGLIEGAEYVLAWTEDGRRWQAEVVASDEFTDVAVLQIDSEEWPAIPLGSGADLWSGQHALAVDHAEQTVRFGEIVAVDPDRVRVDQPAALPGSAIVDNTGAVIAMMSSERSSSRAIPAWLVEQVAVDLISSGATAHPWLGVIAENADGEATVVVRGIVEGSPADTAGLQPDDVIDSINGTNVADAAALWRHVQSSDPGDEAVITITRDGTRRIILATLGTLTD